MIFILFLLTLLLSHSTSNASVLDFCVADLSSPQTPSGYPCKSSVTIKDFVFSNFNEGNTSNFFKFSVTPAFVNQFPAVNGLGISAARLDLDIGGILPMHSHRGATELMIMVQGRITAGFISSDNKVFVKTLSKGEVLVIPQGLLHFQFNAGRNKATAFLTLSSSNPGAQVVDLALFGNNLSSSFVEKTTLLDHAQVKKLKAIFGGSG